MLTVVAGHIFWSLSRYITLRISRLMVVISIHTLGVQYLWLMLVYYTLGIRRLMSIVASVASFYHGIIVVVIYYMKSFSVNICGGGRRVYKTVSYFMHVTRCPEKSGWVNSVSI